MEKDTPPARPDAAVAAASVSTHDAPVAAPMGSPQDAAAFCPPEAVPEAGPKAAPEAICEAAPDFIPAAIPETCSETIPASEPASQALTPFDPVPVQARHDGWTAERQIDFIEALSQSGCVQEACRAVGMSQTSAYKLRGRSDARAFRLAWRVALDHGVERLADAAYSRALHGVPRPIFYRGEQVGEYRVFDEDLTKFILRYRDPVRFGRYKDAMIATQHPEGNAVLLARAMNLLEEQLYCGDADFAAHGFGPAEEADADDDADDDADEDEEDE